LTDFPIAAGGHFEAIGAIAAIREHRGQQVLSYRATTGFGGLAAVTVILLAVQVITGVIAFPL